MRSLLIGKQITVRTDQSLDKYLNEISKIPLISAEKEVQLASRIQTGDSRAIKELVSANLRFVVSVAKQYQHQGLSLSDLINEGNVGLLKAASRFDATRGFKFISYAVWWIRQAIIQALTVHSRLVRLPLNKISVQNKIKKVEAHFEQLNDRKPSIDEISRIMGVSLEEIELCFLNFGKDVSMDAPVSDDGPLSRNDLIPSDSFPSPESQLLTDSLHRDLRDVLNTLNARESEIIRLYFGIGVDRAMSLSEIGQILDLTRERVRQIKEAAIYSIKSSGRASILLKYIG